MRTSSGEPFFEHMPLIAPHPIESERLLVRLVAESDLPALLDVNSNAEVTSLLPYATWKSSADADAWLERMKSMQATGLALQFVVVLKSTGTAIGTCLLFRFEEGSARAELGYVLGRSHWGRGLMQEALRALIGCAFETMGLRRLEAEVDTRNPASARLLRRLGFVKEGLLRQRWVAKGEAKDVEIYGLVRSEWPARASAGNAVAADDAMSAPLDPESFVARQLDAYNARDLNRFLREYTEDVTVYRLPDPDPVIVGRAALAAHYRDKRFNLPELHATLVKRMVFGNKVIDQEVIVGVPGAPMEAAAVYEVTEHGISKVWFVGAE